MLDLIIVLATYLGLLYWLAVCIVSTLMLEIYQSKVTFIGVSIFILSYVLSISILLCGLTLWLAGSLDIDFIYISDAVNLNNVPNVESNSTNSIIDASVESLDETTNGEAGSDWKDQIKKSITVDRVLYVALFVLTIIMIGTSIRTFKRITRDDD